MEKFYQRVAESVMGTYKNNVKISQSVYETTYFINGFTIMNKEIPYPNSYTDFNWHFGLQIILLISYNYFIDEEHARKVYNIISGKLKDIIFDDIKRLKYELQTKD